MLAPMEQILGFFFHGRLEEPLKFYLLNLEFFFLHRIVVQKWV